MAVACRTAEGGEDGRLLQSPRCLLSCLVDDGGFLQISGCESLAEEMKIRVTAYDAIIYTL